MPAPFNPYEILGVSRDADASTIKAAHRQRARQTHPDAGGDARVFADVQRAYEILSDPDKRKHYDATIAVVQPTASTSMQQFYRFGSFNG